MQMPILKYFLYLSPAFIFECREFFYYYLEREAFIINNLSVQVFWQPVRSELQLYERDLIYGALTAEIGWEEADEAMIFFCKRHHKVIRIYLFFKQTHNIQHILDIT